MADNFTNKVELTGNQKRFLAAPKTKDIGNGTRLIFAYTDAEVRVIHQLEILGLLKRYPSTSGFWELTDKGKTYTTTPL
jgi:hypothetical protein